MPDDSQVPDELLEIQVQAMDRLASVARRVVASDPSVGGSTDLFAKWLILRAETSALLRVTIEAGVCTYETYVRAMVEEAKDLADEYIRSSVDPHDEPPPSKIVKPN